MSKGGHWDTPVVMRGEESSATSARVLSAVLVLELLWLVLVAASVVFLAAHLSGHADDFPGDPATRRFVLLVVPPLALALGLALVAARQGVDRRIASPTEPLDPLRRTGLWLTAAANVALVVSILTSLYQAHATWLIVGLFLTTGLSVVAVACMRAARS